MPRNIISQGVHMTKTVTKKHETRGGELFVRKIRVDEQDYPFVKENINNVVVDVTNDVLKFYNPKNGATISLAKALILNRKKRPTKRIYNLSGDPYDLRMENLSYR